MRVRRSLGGVLPQPAPRNPGPIADAPPLTFLRHHEALLHRPHLAEQLLQLLAAGRGREAAHKQGQPRHEARGQAREAAEEAGARESMLQHADRAEEPGDSGSARS